MKNTNPNTTEAKAAKLSKSIAHAERLLSALGGTPEGWAWQGELRRCDRATLVCACGHSGCGVLYGLEKEARGTVWVGSSCINSYAGANPVLVERIQGHVRELQAEARAARAAIKAQAADAEGEALFLELRELADAGAALYTAERQRANAIGRWDVPRDVWTLSRFDYNRAIYRASLTSYADLRQRLGLARQSAVLARIRKSIELATTTLARARAAASSEGLAAARAALEHAGAAGAARRVA